MKLLQPIIKTWQWFNGKKTKIGGLGLSFLALSFVNKRMNPELLEILTWVFSAFVGVGVVHSDMKSDKSIIIQAGKGAVKMAKYAKTFIWI